MLGEHVCKCDVSQSLIHFTDTRQVRRRTQATHRDKYKQRQHASLHDSTARLLTHSSTKEGVRGRFKKESVMEREWLKEKKQHRRE